MPNSLLDRPAFCSILVCLATVTIAATADAQSDSSLFTTVINVPPQSAPDAISSDTQLNVSDGGSVGSFFLAGDFVNQGENIEVNVLGGGIGNDFFAFQGAVVTVAGGTIGDFANASVGSEINVALGSVGNFFEATNGGTLNLRGGSLGLFAEVDAGGVLNISGGSIGQAIRVEPNGAVNLLGTSFLLDGSPLDLELGEPLTIDTRESANLTGELADGSPINFTLNPTLGPAQDYFDPNSTLTVTLVEPVLPGDLNGDATVSAADYAAWRNSIGAEGGQSPNDTVGATVGRGLYNVFKSRFGESNAPSDIGAAISVPEPPAMLLIAVASGFFARPRNRRHARPAGV